MTAFFVWKSRRKIALENIAASISSGNIEGNPEDIARENFRNLGRSLVEIIKIYHGLGSAIFRNLEIRGVDNLRRAAEKGRGVLFITGHCGNWELMALAASYRISPISVVARPLNNPYLNGLVERVRGKYGNSIIYKSGALRKIISQLRMGGCVGILIDQSVIQDEGVLIGFLGRPAWTLKTPAILARKTGAAVVPAFIKRTGDGNLIEVYPEVVLPEPGSRDTGEVIVEDTRLLSSYVERYVRENPSEWLWMHRRWKRTEGLVIDG
jgi:KDO2-lipid IV(A) lauroyltransferase